MRGAVHDTGSRFKVIRTAKRAGITWRLCHFTEVGTKGTRHGILARFDCDLSQDHHDPWIRETEHWWPPEFYFRSGLNEDARRQRERAAREDLED